MAKRQTQTERAIQNLDDQIKALQLARLHLVKEQEAAAAKATKKPVKLPLTDSVEGDA